MRLLFKIITMIYISFIINGCSTASTSFESLKNNKDASMKEYIIKQNYQKIYRNGIKASEKCWDTAPTTIFEPEYNHKRELYTDIKEARFTRGGGGYVLNVITLKSIDNNTTKMNIYMYAEGQAALFSTNIEDVKKRFTGECNACKCE